MFQVQIIIFFFAFLKSFSDFMQSFTTDRYFSCSIKFLHGSLNLFQQKYKWCLTFEAVVFIYYIVLNYA